MNGKKERVVNEIHKPARKNFPRRRTIIKGFDDLWQTDLMELQPYARENRGHRYVLVVIDCFSKFVWTRPLKNKSAVETARAMDDILKKSRVPRNLQSDNGKEFYNSEFAKVVKKYGINHYSTYSVKKAAIAERVIRTLKSHLYRTFSLRGKYKWIDILDQVTTDYNNRRHRTTGMKPKDVSEKTKLRVFRQLKVACRNKYRVGDVVRISKYKSVFDKGYLPQWSTELFKVKKVQITKPPTYLLEDIDGNPISGGFYEEELQKTKEPDVYLIEKVIRKKGNKLYVKWLGMPPHHRYSWIDRTNLTTN